MEDNPQKLFATFLGFFLCLWILTVANAECRDFIKVMDVPLELDMRASQSIQHSPGIKPGNLIFCERICIPRLQRFQNIGKYAHSRRLKIEHPKGVSSKVEVCLHRNITLGLGQCLANEWKMLEKGSLTTYISPYETKYVDIRLPNSYAEPLSISIVEEFREYRIYFLGLGLLMLFFAPIVSSWVPFYYSSAMTFGIILVVLIVLFQGMKLLPTGRKSPFYVILYGSLLGFGSVCLSYLSGLAQSVLQEFGFGEEMLNPVVMLLLVIIILAGAGLGFWGVRKLVLSEDGTVDDATASFVKWAIWIVAAFLIIQSSHDPLLATIMLIMGAVITKVLRSLSFSILRSRHATRPINYHHAQFLSRYPGDVGALKSSPDTFPNKHSSPFTPRRFSPNTQRRGSPLSPSPKYASASSTDDEPYYSSFHKTAKRKVTKENWEKVTKDSTKKALKELMSSPEFTDWALLNTERINTAPPDNRNEIMPARSKFNLCYWLPF